QRAGDRAGALGALRVGVADHRLARAGQVHALRRPLVGLHLRHGTVLLERMPRASLAGEGAGPFTVPTRSAEGYPGRFRGYSRAAAAISSSVAFSTGRAASRAFAWLAAAAFLPGSRVIDMNRPSMSGGRSRSATSLSWSKKPVSSSVATSGCVISRARNMTE